ncbi:MAG: NADH-quinone oxidoreductase subunit L [Acidobacteria bacterium]|nr:NADH-quinone oxidoreductase subunit L [Acidobacteriota bacterium]
MPYNFENGFWVLILFPLLGAAVNGLMGKRFPAGMVALIACFMSGLSFLVAFGTFLQFSNLPGESRVLSKHLFTWIESGNFVASFGLLLDPLSMVMILIITGVGFLIHVYSTRYMREHPGFYRYFAYLNLFIFMMSVLALADNYLMMFIGWEGVGLCSYLLIGYYFDRKSAGDAAKKAFIVNRVGDAGFILGVLLIFRTFQSVEFIPVFEQVVRRFPEAEASFGILSAIALLLFVGAIGKSAQIPLYVWLPDAMEGPTPVSALIHAATMVTAGVYLTARSAALYSRTPEVLALVASIGAITALFAALIATVQTDIKRVLAYSTVSQLGYMFIAVGVGAFGAGIFHLFTHAFFKALLFLGAGSVILALHHEQNLFKMGGLRRYLPITSLTMWIGTLAISGIPPFAGFFSKDEILAKAYESPLGSPLLWALGLVAAGLTAFYMFRLMFLTFHGRGHHEKHPPREDSNSVSIPLLFLALFSLIAGWIGLPPYLGINRFEHFLEPSFRYQYQHGASETAHTSELLLASVTILAAVLGIAVSYLLYVRKPGTSGKLASRFPSVYRILERKFYVDEIYDFLVVHPLYRLAVRTLWRTIDVRLIDGTVNGTGSFFQAWGHLLKRIQAGYARIYASWVLWGALLVILYCYFSLA